MHQNVSWGWRIVGNCPYTFFLVSLRYLVTVDLTNSQHQWIICTVLCCTSGFVCIHRYNEATQSEVLWIFHVMPLNWCHNKFSSTHLWCNCIPNILWTIDCLKTSHADWCQVANWSCICFLWNERAGRGKIHVLHSVFYYSPAFQKLCCFSHH